MVCTQKQGREDTARGDLGTSWWVVVLGRDGSQLVSIRSTRNRDRGHFAGLLQFSQGAVDGAEPERFQGLEGKLVDLGNRERAAGFEDHVPYGVELSGGSTLGHARSDSVRLRRTKDSVVEPFKARGNHWIQAARSGPGTTPGSAGPEAVRPACPTHRGQRNRNWSWLARGPPQISPCWASGGEK